MTYLQGGEKIKVPDHVTMTYFLGGEKVKFPGAMSL